MTDETLFLGLAYDDDRAAATGADRLRLAEAIEGQGFRTAPEEVGYSQLVWLADTEFSASVRLEANWMIQIGVDPQELYVEPRQANPHLDTFARLVGAATEFADSYLGFVSLDADDDLYFTVDDPPVRLEQPLAVVYLGRRYTRDWPDEPEFPAEARWELPAGVLLIPSLGVLG